MSSSTPYQLSQSLLAGYASSSSRITMLAQYLYCTILAIYGHYHLIIHRELSHITTLIRYIHSPHPIHTGDVLTSLLLRFNPLSLRALPIILTAVCCLVIMRRKHQAETSWFTSLRTDPPPEGSLVRYAMDKLDAYNRLQTFTVTLWLGSLGLVLTPWDDLDHWIFSFQWLADHKEALRAVASVSIQWLCDVLRVSSGEALAGLVYLYAYLGWMAIRVAYTAQLEEGLVETAITRDSAKFRRNYAWREKHMGRGKALAWGVGWDSREATFRYNHPELSIWVCYLQQDGTLGNGSYEYRRKRQNEAGDLV